MQHIQTGQKVSVDIEDWYNKSLGRSNIVVRLFDENDELIDEIAWAYFWTNLDVKEVLQKVFPWAHISIDVDFYNEYSECEPSDGDRLREATDIDNGYRSDDDKYDISDWHPYCDPCGEVVAYRVQLTLNKIGNAFLQLNEYLSSEHD